MTNAGNAPFPSWLHRIVLPQFEFVSVDYLDSAKRWKRAEGWLTVLPTFDIGSVVLQRKDSRRTLIIGLDPRDL
ncbi:hypothetical protein J6590_034103 [Homalodisca vitripennis]|nr:hypothetical protein J6590_034103 [Homalodisca vitripennis]